MKKIFSYKKSSSKIIKIGISQTHGGSKLRDKDLEGDILKKKLLEEYKKIKILELKILPQKNTTQKKVISFLWFYENII